MTILHPHWEPTDEHEAARHELRDTSSKKHSILAGSSKLEARSSSAVSRRPAAILGVLLALSVGVVVLRDGSPLESTLTADAVTVAITARGFDPAEARVRPGQTIVWKNDAAIPHIIASETLKTPDGQSLQTSPIFPGATGEYTVALTQPAGTHEYISQTSPLSGTIVIESSAPASGTSISSTPSTAPSSIPSSIAPAVPEESEVPAAVVPDAPAPSAPLPRNPHTVGDRPGIGSALPPGALNASATGYGAATKPFTTPSTGPALWVIGSACLLLFWRFTRRYFRRLKVD